MISPSDCVAGFFLSLDHLPSYEMIQSCLFAFSSIQLTNGMVTLPVYISCLSNRYHLTLPTRHQDNT